MTNKKSKSFAGVMIDFSDLKKTINEMVAEVQKLPVDHIECVGNQKYKIPNGYKLVKINKKSRENQRKYEDVT